MAVAAETSTTKCPSNFTFQMCCIFVKAADISLKQKTHKNTHMEKHPHKWRNKHTLSHCKHTDSSEVSNLIY